MDISWNDFFLNVGFEFIAAILLAATGGLYSLTMRTRRARTNIADRLIELGELAGEIAQNKLPNSKHAYGQSEIVRAAFLLDYELSVFKNMITMHVQNLSPRQTQILRSVVENCDGYLDLVDEKTYRGARFWDSYLSLIQSVSKASKLLRRRGNGRKDRIRALHDAMTDSGVPSAMETANRQPRSELSGDNGDLSLNR